MAIPRIAKGKKRAYEESRASTSSSSLSPVPPERPSPIKRSRAETRQCPVCEEQIPIRLLSMHAQLESERVEEVIRKVGSTDVDFDFEEGPGSSSRTRRSALKARKSMGSRNPSDSSEKVDKTLQTIKRHRKRRQAKLKEMAREEEEGYHRRDAWSRGIAGGEIACPICSATVRGDQDVLDAHVDSCLANHSRIQEEERERELQARAVQDEEEWEEVDDEDSNGGHIGDVRGTGFHTRNPTIQDVDDEVDIDGDDQAAYGEAQFTEGDILPVDIPRVDVEEDVEVEIEGSSEDEAEREQKTLRDLVAEGKVVKQVTPEEGVAAVKAKMDEVMGVGDADRMEVAVVAARKRGDKKALIAALENKVKHLESKHVSSSTSLLCRICIDPYNEPTVSTGCWHTCCRECWLRCLGSTKLCPICKRITGAADLRRIYL